MFEYNKIVAVPAENLIAEPSGLAAADGAAAERKVVEIVEVAELAAFCRLLLAAAWPVGLQLRLALTQLIDIVGSVED